MTLFDFTGQLTSKILDSPIAQEVATSKDDIDQAETIPEKQSLVVTTESNARVLSTEKSSSLSCFTKTPTGNDKETCSSENDQQEVPSDTSAFKGSSIKKVAPSSLDSGSDRSEEQKPKPEDKYLTVGVKDQKNKSTNIARCKYPCENTLSGQKFAMRTSNKGCPEIASANCFIKTLHKRKQSMSGG